MRYPKKLQIGCKQYTFPPLSGGLNRLRPAALLNPACLSNCTNLWWQQGALRTRPGMQRISSRFTYSPNPYVVGRRLHSLGGRALISEYRPGSPVAFLLWELTEQGELREICRYMGYDAACFSCYEIVEVLPEAALSEAEFLVYAEAGRVFGVCPSKEQTLVELTNQIYVPLYRTGCSPLASQYHPVLNGTPYEEPNLLTNRVRVQFTTHRERPYYFLPAQKIIGDVHLQLTLFDGSVVTKTIPAGVDEVAWSVLTVARVRINRQAGYLAFMDDSGLTMTFPAADMRNDFEVTFCLPDAETPHLNQCGLHTYFGGDRSRLGGGTRLFMAGDPQKVNMVRWSSVNNPLYFPIYNRYRIGKAAPIKAMAQQGHQLIFFQEHAIYAADSVSGEVPTAEQLASGAATGVETGSGYFPVTHVHGSIGCDAPESVQLCRNHLVFCHRGRVYGLYATSNVNQTDVRLLSSALGEGFLNATEPLMSGVEQDYYLLVNGKDCFALWLDAPGFATGDQQVGATGESRLAWYHWRFPHAPDNIWNSPVGAIFFKAFARENEDGTINERIQPAMGAFRLVGQTDEVVRYTLQGAARSQQPVVARLATAQLALAQNQKEAVVHKLQLALDSAAGEVCATGKTDFGSISLPACPISEASNQVVNLRAGVFRTRLFGLQLEFCQPVVLHALSVFYQKRTH